MLTLRRLPLRFIRRNATLSEAVATHTPPPPAANPKGKANPPHLEPASTPVEQVTEALKRRRTRDYTNRRPNISLSNPREWNRPLPVGVLPAYDQALKVIQRDSAGLKAEAGVLREKIAQLEKAEEGDDPALEGMRDKLRILEVQSEVNLPDVRWKFANGMADLTKPVYRHLVEQRWREEGALDLLMERIHQMNVIPDVLPDLHPSLDLRITFPEPPPTRVRPGTTPKIRHQQVEPGVYLLPNQTVDVPRVYTTVFHVDTRHYTLLMIDPDVPDEATEGFQTYVHWLQPNIPLSVSSSAVTLTDAHTPYVPPHPQRGTPYHRYVLLLLPQKGEISVPALSEEERLGFDVRAFLEKHGLNPAQGGGAHMWREVWNEEVSNIYKGILEKEEPKFGRPPKADPYAEYKKSKRYI